MIVDESVYFFKKSTMRNGSVSINTTKLAPLDDKNIMKAML